MVLIVKNPPANAGDVRDMVLTPGEDPLEDMAARFSVLAWRTPWRDGPGGLRSTGSQRAGHD